PCLQALCSVPTTPPASRSARFPYTTLFRSGIFCARCCARRIRWTLRRERCSKRRSLGAGGDADRDRRIPHARRQRGGGGRAGGGDRQSTRLNSSHVQTSYAAFRMKKKTHDL